MSDLISDIYLTGALRPRRAHLDARRGAERTRDLHGRLGFGAARVGMMLFLETVVCHDMNVGTIDALEQMQCSCEILFIICTRNVGHIQSE